MARTPTTQDRLLRELKRHVPRAAPITDPNHPGLPDAGLPVAATTGDERLEYGFQPWAAMATDLPHFLHAFARARAGDAPMTTGLALQPRWVMSLMRGPMTRTELRRALGREHAVLPDRAAPAAHEANDTFSEEET